jgi:diguanylate cyclase (GGDEF)-like protein
LGHRGRPHVPQRPGVGDARRAGARDHDLDRISILRASRRSGCDVRTPESRAQGLGAALPRRVPDPQARGRLLWLRARGRVVERDSGGRALRLAGTYADISERKIAEARLRRLAEFDALTELPNRAQFLDRLQQAMARATRDKAMALLFLDIDHFKGVNDSRGHGAGDTLLRIVAERLLSTVRGVDTVARLAGDEFTVILEGLAEPADAEVVAMKMVEALRPPMRIGDALVSVSTSVGLAVLEPSDVDAASLLRRADEALYEAKRAGRDRYVKSPAVAL